MFLLGLRSTSCSSACCSPPASTASLIPLIAGGLAAVQLFASDKLALHAMGAREVTPQEAPELHAMIERLCIQADLPKPKIAVADTEMPNAFAIGRSQKSATVCATTGIMKLLSPAELEGVMAHELAHVKNRDVMIMTIASFFASIAAMILQFGFLFGGGHSDDDDSPGFLVILLVSLVVYVLSFLLMMALSRYREFAADRGAALITGARARWLGAAQDLAGMERLPQQDLRAPTSSARSSSSRLAGKAHRRPVLDAPADGEAHRGAHAARGPAAGPARWPPRMGFLDILGQEEAQARRPPTGCSRCRRRTSRSTPTHGSQTKGVAAIVFQPLATADFEAIVAEMEELLPGTGEDTGTTIATHRRLARLPLDDPARPRHRGPRRRRQRRQHALRSAATATACSPPSSPSRTPRPSASTSSTTTSAATWYPFVPACGDAIARRRARAAGQGR